MVSWDGGVNGDGGEVGRGVNEDGGLMGWECEWRWW